MLGFIRVGFIWLELEIDEKTYLVGAATEIGEDDFPKLFNPKMSEADFFKALDKTIYNDGRGISEELDPPEGWAIIVCLDNDPNGERWIIEFESADDTSGAKIPLALSQVKRIFFEWIFEDEFGIDAINFVTGECYAESDLKDHPQEVLHGNDLRWLEEYGLGLE